MKKLLFLGLWMLPWLLMTTVSRAQTPKYAILPQPLKLEEKSGTFTLSGSLTLVLEKENADVRRVATQLADQIARVTGHRPTVTTARSPRKNAIFFAVRKGKNARLGEEGYTLNVTSKNVIITAEQPKGFFYGVQSLLQLMPAEIFSAKPVSGVAWTVPCCVVEDQPRFGYRGMMLDVGRHFFPVDYIKRYIDLMVLHKVNTLHWHLTEDQGWRIEIKKYPLLTQIGSQRKQTMVGHYRDNKFDGKPYGGFYTQDEVRDIVKYAQDRFVTVIPEIEMPGHSRGVLAGYPQFGSSPDRIVEVATTWGVHDDVLFPREETFQFLEDVLTEVMELFPSQYIHIGGDECPKIQWHQSRFCQEIIKREGLKDEHGLQSYFIGRIDKFITSKGRKMIGWDEILEGGLSPNATVMSWRGTEGGIAAAKQGHDAIMTPTTYCYLDYYQADPKTEKLPVAIGGYLPLEKVYSYEPIPDTLSTDVTKHIIGVQSNIWTEYIATPEYLEYMVYPRALAIAEVGWSPKSSKNFDNFKQRLEAHKKRLDYLNVNYYGAPINSNFTYQWPLPPKAKK